eukprot:873249-Prymnesium_polylepis.1
MARFVATVKTNESRSPRRKRRSIAPETATSPSASTRYWSREAPMSARAFLSSRSSASIAAHSSGVIGLGPGHPAAAAASRTLAATAWMRGEPLLCRPGSSGACHASSAC